MLGKTNAVSGKPTQTKTVEFNPGSANNITIIPDDGYLLSSVEVGKPLTMIPENIKKDVNIGGVIGTHEGGITIQPVTNITLNNKGVLSWTAPDTSEIENKGYTATFSYDVYVNDEKKCTVNSTSASLYEYLSEGENNIKVIAKAEIKYFKSETETIGIWTSSVAITVVTLNTRLPVVNGFSAAASINDKAYIFGGRDKSSTYKTILEFDPTTNTIATLDTTFSSGMQAITAVTIDDKIYIFGSTDAIFEFDPITKTLTTLSIRLSNYIS